RAEVRGHLTRRARGHGGPERCRVGASERAGGARRAVPRASARVTPAPRDEDPLSRTATRARNSDDDRRARRHAAGDDRRRFVRGTLRADAILDPVAVLASGPRGTPWRGASMIEAIALAKRYGATEALAGVSFAAKPGEIVGYLGPNGAGKS